MNERNQGTVFIDRRNQRSYSADGEYDKPDRGTTGTYKGDVFAFPFNILPSRGVFFL